MSLFWTKILVKIILELTFRIETISKRFSVVEATVTLIKHDFEKGTPHCFFFVVVVVVVSTFFGEK